MAVRHVMSLPHLARVHAAKLETTDTIMDRLTPEHRSWVMSRIRGKDTRPELFVRRLIHAEGFRYRLHRKSLPGSPDLVFPSRRKIIFVHGCFWHQHGCKVSKLPKTRTAYWSEKFERNRIRDEENRAELELLEWRVLVVWECETKSHDKLKARILNFLAS